MRDIHSYESYNHVSLKWYLRIKVSDFMYFIDYMSFSFIFLLLKWKYFIDGVASLRGKSVKCNILYKRFRVMKSDSHARDPRPE